MREFKISVNIKAVDEAQAREIVDAVNVMLNQIQSSDLITLAKKVKANPGIVKTALRYI